MPTYGGVYFEVESSGSDGFVPTWVRESHVSRSKIPLGPHEDVQYGGRGHWRWIGEIHLDSHADYLTLEALAGTDEGRDLSDFIGEDYTGVRLNSVSKPQHDAIREWHRLQVDFERAS